MLIEITLRQCKYMSFQKEAQFMTCMYSMSIQQTISAWKVIMRPYSQEEMDTETGKSWEWVSERKKGGWLQELVLHHLPHCLFRDSRLSLLSTLLRCSYAPSAAVTMATSPTDLHKTMEGDLFVWSISMTQRHLHHCQPRSQSFWKYDWT